MRRCVPIPIVLVLAVVTASTVTLILSTLAPASVDRESRGAQIEVARRFYVAVDTLLQTGEPAELERLVPPDFTDHALNGGTGREGMIRSIRDIRGRFPSARLTVADLYESGEKVVAMVGIAGIDGDDVLGLEASGGMATWAPVEVLRIAGNQIIERWSVAPGDVYTSPFFAARISPPPASATATDRAPVLSLRVDRLTIDAGASVLGTDETATIVYVEAGRVEATVDSDTVLLQAGERGPDGVSGASGEETLIGAGNALTIPARAWRRLRAAGSEQATVLNVQLGSAPFPEIIPPDQPKGASPSDVAAPGVAGLTLVDAHPDVAIGTDSVSIECGRVILAPNTFVTGVGTQSMTIVFVEHGTLTAENDGERRSFEAGTALIALSGDVTILRNSGVEHLSLIVFSIGADSSIVPAP